MDIIRTVYYIHGPWRAKKNFCCFICVSYGPYTLLQNDSFLHLLEYTHTVASIFISHASSRLHRIWPSRIFICWWISSRRAVRIDWRSLCLLNCRRFTALQQIHRTTTAFCRPLILQFSLQFSIISLNVTNTFSTQSIIKLPHLFIYLKLCAYMWDSINSHKNSSQKQTR